MFKKIKLYGLAMLMAVGTLFSSQAMAETSPYVLMQQAANKLFGDIKANQARIKQDPNYLRTIVRNDLMPYVHVKYAGQSVLGKSFADATDAQKEAFYSAFRQYIEQSYAQVLTQYNNQDIKIESEKPTDGKSLVSIRVNVSGNAGPVKLDFKWRKNSKTNQWQAYDMAAEGVSMITTKQNEWSGIIRQKGIDALTAHVAAAAKKSVTFSK